MIKAYLVDRVSLLREHRDEYGEIISTDITELICRVDWKRRKIVTAHGEELMSEALIMLEARDIHEDDKIRIDAKDWKILRIAKPKDFSWGFIEVYI